MIASTLRVTLRAVSASAPSRLVQVIDTVAAARSSLTGEVRHLASCHPESWGLRIECPTPEDPLTDVEVCWLLPADAVQLSARRPRSRHARRCESVMSAVRIRQHGRHWCITDLLLGIATDPGTPSRLVGLDDFAAAVAVGELGPVDADHALRTVHRIQGQLAGHRYHVGGWLADRGILRTWPPFG